MVERAGLKRGVDESCDDNLSNRRSKIDESSRSQKPPQDLAAVPKLLGELFEQPRTAEAWAKYALSQEQIDAFNEDGFLTGVQILSEEQVEKLCAELETLYDRNHPAAEYWYAYDCDVPTEDPRDKLFHSLGAWRIAPGFHDICWSPAFRMAAFQLLGGPYRLLHDQLFCKPAKDGSVVAWHQDYSYWTWTKPMAHLTCWVGLDDVTTESGCLWYVPGSQRWGLLPMTGLAGDMDAVKQVLDTDQIETLDKKKTPAVLKRGHAVFHHPLMMHGSYGNTSPNQRRATVINVMCDGCTANVGDKDMGKFPHPPDGERMQGLCYPLLVGDDLAQMAEAAGSACNPVNELNLASFETMMQKQEKMASKTSYKHSLIQNDS